MTLNPQGVIYPSDPSVRRAIVQEEVLLILRDSQEWVEDEGTIRRSTPTFLQRLWGPLEYVGGMLLGVNLAVLAILFNFVVFNFLLHMEF